MVVCFHSNLLCSAKIFLHLLERIILSGHHVHFSSTDPPQQMRNPHTILVLNEGKIGPFSILSSGISEAWPAKNPFNPEGLLAENWQQNSFQSFILHTGLILDFALPLFGKGKTIYRQVSHLRLFQGLIPETELSQRWPDMMIWYISKLWIVFVWYRIATAEDWHDEQKFCKVLCSNKI